MTTDLDRRNTAWTKQASLVTDLIAKESLLPWSLPDSTDDSKVSWQAHTLPYNADSNEYYHGHNRWVLLLRCQQEGWTQRGFLTFNQVKALGGTVIKGSVGTPLVVTTTNGRYNVFTVFNLQQATWPMRTQFWPPHQPARTWPQLANQLSPATYATKLGLNPNQVVESSSNSASDQTAKQSGCSQVSNQTTKGDPGSNFVRYWADLAEAWAKSLQIPIEEEAFYVEAFLTYLNAQLGMVSRLTNREAWLNLLQAKPSFWADLAGHLQTTDYRLNRR